VEGLGGMRKTAYGAASLEGESLIEHSKSARFLPDHSRFEQHLYLILQSLVADKKIIGYSPVRERLTKGCQARLRSLRQSGGYAIKWFQGEPIRA